MLLVIAAAFAQALVPAEVVGNGLENGLGLETATESTSEVPFDQSQGEETPKTNSSTKHRRNPFAKMFPEFEQIPVPDDVDTGEGKQDTTPLILIFS